VYAAQATTYSNLHLFHIPSAHTKSEEYSLYRQLFSRHHPSSNWLEGITTAMKSPKLSVIGAGVTGGVTLKNLLQEDFNTTARGETRLVTSGNTPVTEMSCLS
jgi:hypothetical protein